MKKQNNKAKQANSTKIQTRREILSKYGAYTAPVVVSLLIPSKTYADGSNMAIYSNATTCAESHSMTPAQNSNHCMNVHGL